MTIDIPHGSPQFPTVSGSVVPFTRDEMDAAVKTLQAHKNAWVALSVRERIAIVTAFPDSKIEVTNLQVLTPNYNCWL